MTNKKILPNFLIIGAAKSGTTSLYYYLKEHPQIYMPEGKKEPHFFVLEGKKITDFHHSYKNLFSYSVTTLEEYYHLFEGVTNELAIGEASAKYLYYESAIANIQKYIPNVKILVILRNPVDRAYSQFCGRRRLGIEDIKNFSEAISTEKKRIIEGWEPGYHYIQMGFFYKQLSRYYKAFSPEQIKVVLYDDLKKDSQSLCTKICDFLGVDPSFVASTQNKYNVGYLPKNENFYTALKKNSRILKNILQPEIKTALKNAIDPFFRKPIPPLSPEERESLKRIYYDDILKLQDLLNKDLGHWLN